MSTKQKTLAEKFGLPHEVLVGLACIFISILLFVLKDILGVDFGETSPLSILLYNITLMLSGIFLAKVVTN